MASASLHLRLQVDRDYLEHALMAHTLREIVRLQEEEPWGFAGGDAADLAAETLEYVDGEEGDPRGY